MFRNPSGSQYHQLVLDKLLNISEPRIPSPAKLGLVLTSLRWVDEVMSLT